MKQLTILPLLLALFLTVDVATAQSEEKVNQNDEELSLITNTPEEGFQVAIQLARKGVTETQSDREVLFALREVYAKDPDALIASSQVIAIHFQTVAAANNYWRKPK
jgi:hypothetical protein